MTSEKNDQVALTGSATRRQAIAGAFTLMGGLAVGSNVLAQPQQATPGAAPKDTRTSLHQEMDLNAGPQRLYDALIDAKSFAAFTGLPATIDARDGGAFSLFGGLVVGRNIELIPAQRIVQAWRPTHWVPGVYSIVKFEIKPHVSQVTVVLDHTGFPEGEFEGLSSGWGTRYWEPLKKFLA